MLSGLLKNAWFFSISREMSDKSMHAQFWGFTFAYVKFGQWCSSITRMNMKNFSFRSSFRFPIFSLWFLYDTRVTHTRPIFLHGMNFKCTNKKRVKKRRINITRAITNHSFFHKFVRNIRHVSFHLISLFHEITYIFLKNYRPVLPVSGDESKRR